MTDQRDLLGKPDEAEALRLLEEGADAVPEAAWAPMLVQMTEVVEARLRRERINGAEALARGVVLELAQYFGGRRVYVPAGDRLKTALRDMEIYRRAKRGNIQALADEYQLTDIQIYRIIRQQKALHLSRIQGRLFEERTGGES